VRMDADPGRTVETPASTYAVSSQNLEHSSFVKKINQRTHSVKRTDPHGQTQPVPIIGEQSREGMYNTSRIVTGLTRAVNHNVTLANDWNGRVVSQPDLLNSRGSEATKVMDAGGHVM